MAETEAEAKKQASSAGRNKQLAAGMMAVLCLLVAAFFLWRQTDKTPSGTATAAAEFAVIDMQRALVAHPRGAELTVLRQEQEELSLELRQARNRLLQLTAPQLGKKPFQDAARQKTTQEMIRRHGEFMAELEKQEKAKREATRPEYEAARDEINQLFLNEIFNIRLKLDNADSLRLSEEGKQELEARLKTLQHQRGARQMELRQKYESAIRSWREEIAAQHGIDMRELQAETSDRQLSEEMKKRSEAQARDLTALQQNMQQRVEQRRKVAELQLALKAKQREADKLETELLQEIASRVAKLALRHNAGVVLAQRAKNPRAEQAGWSSLQDIPARYVNLVNVKSVDLTEELLPELKALPAKAK